MLSHHSSEILSRPALTTPKTGAEKETEKGTHRAAAAAKKEEEKEKKERGEKF